MIGLIGLARFDGGGGGGELREEGGPGLGSWELASSHHCCCRLTASSKVRARGSLSLSLVPSLLVRSPYSVVSVLRISSSTFQPSHQRTTDLTCGRGHLTFISHLTPCPAQFACKRGLSHLELLCSATCIALLLYRLQSLGTVLLSCLVVLSRLALPSTTFQDSSHLGSSIFLSDLTLPCLAFIFRSPCPYQFFRPDRSCL